MISSSSSSSSSNYSLSSCLLWKFENSFLVSEKVSLGLREGHFRPKGGWPIDSVGIAYRASDGGRGAYANLSGLCNFIGFTTCSMRISENGAPGKSRPRFGGPARIALRPTNETHFQKVRDSKSFEFLPAPNLRHSKRLWF